MRIDILRRKFPEYGDVPDQDLIEMFHNMLTEVMQDPPAKYSEIVTVPGVENAIRELATLLDRANLMLVNINKSVGKLDKPEKPEKEEKDLSPHFMALGVQLKNIEAAVLSLAENETEDAMPEMEDMAPPKVVKYFDIKRDELGAMDRVIPVYEA